MTDKEAEALIDGMIENLNGHCIFIHCPGPDVEPVNMATCRVCHTIRDLKRLKEIMAEARSWKEEVDNDRV